MNVDVEIYLSNIIKFFKENPQDLWNLIPKDKEEEFYLKVKEKAFDNYKKENEASLTQKQMIDICRELSDAEDRLNENLNIDGVFLITKFGNICLN